MSANRGPPGPPSGAPPGPPGMRPPGPPSGAPMGQPFYPPPIQAGLYPPGPPGGMPNFPPPLPAGWSEHLAPDKVTKYYYNSNTKQSTYIRPTFNPVASSSSVPAEAKKKKEKPKQKIAIPGTTWQRITTSEGNVFYFEKASKRSEWTIPDEIKDAVEVFDREEEERKEREEKEEKERIEKERLDRLKERERIRLELEEERAKKRKSTEENGESVKKPRTQINGDENGKKKEAGEGEDANADEDAAEGEDADYAPADEDDEDAWQRAVAAEFAEQDAKAKEDEEEQKEKVKDTEAEAAKKIFAVPEKVNVSLEEGRALFKALLIEKDIGPFAPWDQSLPLFITDPRYVLLSSEKDRREVYEEYCRDVGRARRLNKGSTAVAESSKKVDPEREYKALMREDVTSTRTRWEDFKRKYKKDRRFYSFGRDDRDREKGFKTHLRELGERKRADAQRAETDFFDLLKEVDGISPDSKWTEVKRGISSDPRYDAVGSSSLREELFKTYLGKLGSIKTDETPEQAAKRRAREKKEKAEQSLREREAQVREEKGRVEREVGKSKAGAGREEGERLYGTLLVDQVRDPEISWNDALQFLQVDQRFNHPSLSPFDKQRLFNDHMARLSSKRSGALYSLFDANTPDLQTPFDKVYPAIVDDPIVKRLDLSPSALEDRWNAWKRTKDASARQAFDELLGENSFVEFWGKMRKKVLDAKALEIKEEDEMEEGEGMGEGGSADLTAMGRQIDLEEIKSVLRRDKRYRQFDHIPDQREKWLRDYLETLDAASGSKTVHNVGGTR